MNHPHLQAKVLLTDRVNVLVRDQMPKKRMPEDNRGFVRPPRHVIAITRQGAVWYRTLAECRDEYHIRTTEQLARMIDSGQVASDGYTTFEEPIEGVIYFGMTEQDIMEVLKTRLGK